MICPAFDSHGAFDWRELLRRNESLRNDDDAFCLVGRHRSFRNDWEGEFKKKLSFLQSQGNPLMIEAYSTHQRQWNHTRPLIDASTSCTYISLSEIRCLALDSALA